jgi:putative transposase
VNFVHCVFSTKGRAQLVRNPEALWAYLWGIARNLKFDLLAAGGTFDHIRLLLSLPAERMLADVVRALKANSSRPYTTRVSELPGRTDTVRSGVSPSQLQTAREYIRIQEEHHRRRSFDDEYLAMLSKAGVRCDASDVLGECRRCAAHDVEGAACPRAEAMAASGNIAQESRRDPAELPRAALPAESLTQISFTLHHAGPGSLLTRNEQDALGQRLPQRFV